MCEKLVNEIEVSILDKVNHIPTSYFNIFSGKFFLKNGWTMEGDNDSIVLTKENRKILFDINITTTKGLIFVMYHCPSTEIYGAATDVGTRMLLTKAHILISHLKSSDWQMKIQFK